MIQATVDRLQGLCPPENLLIVTNEILVDPIAKQLPALPSTSVIGEPAKRDTAPCIGLAAAWVAAKDPDATMVVMPADHVISPDDVFQKSLQHAADLVEQDPTRIVTFGIKPSYPAEVFGYIERQGAAFGRSPTQKRLLTSWPKVPFTGTLGSLSGKPKRFSKHWRNINPRCLPTSRRLPARLIRPPFSRRSKQNSPRSKVLRLTMR